MEFYTVDAFTSVPFAGNPAAIVPLNTHLSESRMQDIATEMNLSETAYLTQVGNTADHQWKTNKRFNLRWFTPKNEIVLCGHATLASAHVLFNELGNTSSTLEFDTLSGILKASREGSKIKLSFPSLPGSPLTAEQEQEFLPLVKAVAGQHKVTDVLYEAKTKNILVCLSSNINRETFETFEPNFEALQIHDGSKVKGIVVTVRGCLGSSGERGFHDYDFVSRYFAPWHGVLEDPVTGSTHTILAPFWSPKLDKKELKCRQCSPRGGELLLRLKDDTVEILGDAVTVLSGKFR